MSLPVSHLTCLFPAGFGGDASPGGQTQEHAQLARSLGVEQMTVVISKLDTCDYSQVRVLRGTVLDAVVTHC